MKKYEAPKLNVDNYVADTMIASSGTKNSNAGNNQNCWGCNQSAGSTDPGNTENSCFYLPSMGEIYTNYCG